MKNNNTNRNWLVFANRSKCDHAKALKELGFINWKMGKTLMNIGDTVYLFMSDERRIRFKTEVVAKNCIREDSIYWNLPSGDDETFKLNFVAEYTGNELDEKFLEGHGFKDGRSIERPMCNNPELFQYINEVFENKSCIHLIDEVIPTEKSRELVKKIIPILVRWAKERQTKNTYDELIKELGYERFSGIARQLDYVHLVFQRFKELKGLKEDELPTLNALVNSGNGLPSSGFDIVYPNYSKMSDSEKKIFVNGLNQEAVEYKHWNWVLKELGLAPSIINIKDEEKEILSGKFFGQGGEGEEHKKLKEYIFHHPEKIGIKGVEHKEMEHILLSGDRLDVYFELKNGLKIAVEVKPATSSYADILRGIFQCVKYKTILDAEDTVHGKKTPNRAILVTGGEMSTENNKVREALCVTAFHIECDDK